MDSALILGTSFETWFVYYDKQSRPAVSLKIINEKTATVRSKQLIEFNGGYQAFPRWMKNRGREFS